MSGGSNRGSGGGQVYGGRGPNDDPNGLGPGGSQGNRQQNMDRGNDGRDGRMDGGNYR